MPVEHIEIMVEEPSMETALLRLLPKILGSISFSVYPFQCKNELLDHLPVRLRGYRSWLPDNWRILILVDRDDDNCVVLKRRLEEISRACGFVTKSSASGTGYQVINRLVIEELEAWYFGDWEAVRAAYPRSPANIPNKASYRNPDDIPEPWEAFERVLQRVGYFKGGLRKNEAARKICVHMDPWRNSSRSFQKLCEAVTDLLNQG
jgi:hypothetical protein